MPASGEHEHLKSETPIFAFVAAARHTELAQKKSSYVGCVIPPLTVGASSRNQGQTFFAISVFSFKHKKHNQQLSKKDGFHECTDSPKFLMQPKLQNAICHTITADPACKVHRCKVIQ